MFVPGCGSTAPVVKFGLVAPFEGRYRRVGYDAIYAARLAVRELNAAGGAGGYRVELVAYDDGGLAPAAGERARQLVLDPQVVAVLGHYRVETTRAAWDVYAQAALPLIAPVIPADSVPDSLCQGCAFPAAFRTGPPGARLGAIGLDDVLAGGVPAGTIFEAGAPWPKDVPEAQDFVIRYRALAGVEPGPFAWATYQATRLLFDAIERSRGDVSRRGVGAQLARDFDARGMRPASAYLYRLDDQRLPVLHQPVRQ